MGFLLHLVLATAAWTSQTDNGITLVRPQNVVDGQLMVTQVEGTPRCDRARITWMNHRFDGFKVGDVHQMFLPVRLGLTPGDQTMKVRCGGREAKFIVPVNEGTFPESKLTVDPKFDKAPPARVVDESAAIAHSWTLGHKERLWKQPFVRPAQGIDTSLFGVKRTYNGSTKGRHRGLDLDGAAGDPIVAANDGYVVLLADDFFFVGNAVFIDHGAGLFTLYFHMTKTAVALGDKVKRGQKIGTIGKTGRVTGPHLHFSVKLGDTYVNPADLLAYDGQPLTAESTVASAATKDATVTAPK